MMTTCGERAGGERERQVSGRRPAGERGASPAGAEGTCAPPAAVRRSFSRGQSRQPMCRSIRIGGGSPPEAPRRATGGYVPNSQAFPSASRDRYVRCTTRAALEQAPTRSSRRWRWRFGARRAPAPPSLAPASPCPCSSMPPCPNRCRCAEAVARRVPPGAATRPRPPCSAMPIGRWDPILDQRACERMVRMRREGVPTSSPTRDQHRSADRMPRPPAQPRSLPKEQVKSWAGAGSVASGERGAFGVRRAASRRPGQMVLWLFPWSQLQARIRTSLVVLLPASCTSRGQGAGCSAARHNMACRTRLQPAQAWALLAPEQLVRHMWLACMGCHWAASSRMPHIL